MAGYAMILLSHELIKTIVFFSSLHLDIDYGRLIDVKQERVTKERLSDVDFWDLGIG